VFALASDDGSAKGSVEITPFPIQAVGDGGCRLSVRPMSANGDSFSIAGQGFHPDQKVKGIAVSSGERAEVPVDNKGGAVKVVIFPAVVGRSGGEASFSASDSACSVTVHYKWGDQMRGAALTGEQRGALSQEMRVVDGQASEPAPAISKPSSSGGNNGWSALAQRGRSLWKEGKRAEAEPLLAQSLAMAEKELGPNDARVARLSYDLASLDTSLGRYAEAEPLFQRALVAAEKALGPDHENVAKVLMNYADLMRKTKRPEEADQMEARARKIRGEAAP
jgi:Tetratricopeptide repeat